MLFGVRIVWSCGLAARGRHRYANVVSCWGRVNELTFLYCIITFGEGSYIYVNVNTVSVYEVGIEQTCTETCTNPVDEDVMTITIMYIGQCCSSVRVNIYIWCVDMNIVVALLESKATGRFCLSTTNHRLSLDDAGHRHLSRNVEEIRQETLAAATTCCTKSAHKRYGNEIQAPLGYDRSTAWNMRVRHRY